MPKPINTAPPRVVISTSSLNSYGTRVLTSGLDITQYQKNPVLLYMHERGHVIGHVEDLAIEGDQLMGTLIFDEVSDRSRSCKAQFAKGSLKMVSAGIDIIAWSEAPELLLEGQTSPTVVRSRLFEVSVVDIGANPDALVLRYEGQTLNLAAGAANALPQLTSLSNNPTNFPTMELKELTSLLSLSAVATEADVKHKIAELCKTAQEATTLRQELSTLRLSAVTAAVEAAISAQRITADKKAHFVELGQLVGLDRLNTTLSAMPQSDGRISAVIGHQGQALVQTYTKLSEVPAHELEAMRADDRETYIKLYMAEYGFAPDFQEP